MIFTFSTCIAFLKISLNGWLQVQSLRYCESIPNRPTGTARPLARFS